MAKRKYRCPKCGEKTGADILYGEPAWDLVKDDVRAGYLVIGGCCVDPNNPDRECTNCGHQWRIKRRKPQYPDELDPIPTLLKFNINSFSGMNYQIEWADGILTYSKGPSIYHDVSTTKRLSQKEWTTFWCTLLTGNVSIWHWKNHYDNPRVLDGTQWELVLVQGEYKKNVYGSNAYPGCICADWTKSPEFSCLVSAICQLVGEAEFLEHLTTHTK